MGKRNKEPQVGRRRPMIQLGNARKTVGVVSRNTTVEEEVPGVTEKKLENALEEQKSAAANNMDDELAGFLAEINSLETPQEVAATNGKVVPDPTTAAALLYDPTTFDPSTQGHLLPAPWEACYDESTGYYYYWNKTTNEVQWYPPTVTVPPPPPPPPPPTEPEEKEAAIDSPLPVAEKEENDENIEPETDDVCQEDEESPENELEKEDAEDNEVSVTVKVEADSQESVHEKEESPDKDKKNEKENIIEREEENDGMSSVDREKEKDKELMNQIKEKIRRKKEEKLMKEKEELSAIKQQQQEKEDMLREKLIQKKKEREEKKESPPVVAKSLTREKSPIADKKIVDIKLKSSEEDQDDKDEGENDAQVLNESKTEEDFSLDMFAEEINNSPKNVLGKKVEGGKSQDHHELTETKVMVKEILTKTEDMETATESPLENKEVKGSWRIVDSVYDEDDDDEEDDGVKDESESENNSSSDSEGSEKSAEEMEDYANMLLEDGIVEEKKDSKTKKSRSNAPPIPETPIDAPPPPPPDTQPPLPPEDELLPALPEMSVEEEESRKIEIDSLSTEIFEKLDFLGITTKELRNLTRYLVEIEARHKDWKAGALNTKYFLKCLNELSEKIVQHEEQAAPPGWLCHWSSEFKMYYYYNTVSGESQWEYPEPPQSQEETVTELALTEAPPPPPDESELNKASLVSPAHGFSREPVQTNTKIKKKKRPVVEETPQIQDPYRDPYRQSKRMKSDPPEENTFSGNESGTSSPLTNVIAAAPQIMRTREFSPVPSGGNLLLPCDDNIDGTQSPLPYKQEKVAPTNKPKVKKKKKPESGNLLPNKKLKHVSSLVQKWQTVKQQVEEEENAELESDEEDYETASERRIEEWKKEVEVTGEKEYNPNFMEIKSDWRERLLKRKT